MRVLALFIVIVTLQNCAGDSSIIEISESTYSYSIKVLSDNLGTASEELEERIALQEERNNTDGFYSRFSPILSILRTISASYREYEMLSTNYRPFIESGNRLIEGKEAEIIERKVDEIRQIASNHFEVMSHMIEDNQEIFAFNQEEKTAFLEALRGEIEINQQILEDNPKASSSNAEMVMRLLLLDQEFIRHQKIFEEYAMMLQGSRIECFFNIMRPLIIPKKSCLHDGDIFEAELMLVSNISRYDPNNAEIIVNGDTLQINEQGIANYSIPVEGIDSLILVVKGGLRSSLTGEIIAGDAEVTYYVHK